MTTLEEIGVPLFFALGCLIIFGGLIGALWAPFACWRTLYGSRDIVSYPCPLGPTR